MNAFAVGAPSIVGTTKSLRAPECSLVDENQDPCTDKVFRTPPQLFKLASFVRIFQDRKDYPIYSAGFTSHWARNNLVLSVRWIGLSRYWTVLSKDSRMLCCRGLELEWSEKPRDLMQNHRVGQLLDCKVQVWDQWDRSFSWGRKILAWVMWRVRLTYSKQCVRSSTNFWRFRIQLNLFRVWTVHIILSDRVWANCSFKKRLCRWYP